MLKYLNLYWSFLKNNLTRDMYFQANFWMTAGEGVSLFLINLLLYSAIFANVQEIGGWNKWWFWSQLIKFFQHYSMVYSPITYLGFSITLIGVNWISFFWNLLVHSFIFPPVMLVLVILSSCIASVPLLIFALHELEIYPGLGEVLVYVLLLINGLLIGYSLLLIFMIIDEKKKKIGGAYLIMMEVLSYGRYPGTIFSGFMRIIFNFIIPMGFIAHYPAETLFKGIQWTTVFTSYLLTAVFLMISKWFLICLEKMPT